MFGSLGIYEIILIFVLLSLFMISIRKKYKQRGFIFTEKNVAIAGVLIAIYYIGRNFWVIFQVGWSLEYLEMLFLNAWMGAWTAVLVGSIATLKKKKWGWLLSLIGYGYILVNAFGFISNRGIERIGIVNAILLLTIFSVMLFYVKNHIIFPRKGIDFETLKEEKMGNLTFLPRTENNIYSKVEQEKYGIIMSLQRIVEEKEIANSEITHSMPYSDTEWVQLRVILNKENFSELQIRLTLKITIIGNEFHKYPFEYRLLLVDNDKERLISGVCEMHKRLLTTVVDHLMRRKKVPLKELPRFRLFPFQFWRPKNKVDRIKISTLSNIAKVLYIAGVLLFAIPVIGISLIVLGFSFSLADWLRRRKSYIVTSGKPAKEPRNLSLIDSWQTVVFNIGNKAKEVKTDLIKKLRSSLNKDALCEEENIWYWGLDGKVERSQIVLRHNRGIVFVHVYPYGEDLYIGWDAHLNYGQWNEHIAGAGYHKQTKDYVKLKAIKPGFQSVNEYDIQDVVSLAEWCHAQIVKAAKIIIKENNIDQEIDFNIIRERRSEFTKKEAPKKAPFGGKSLFGFRRT